MIELLLIHIYFPCELVVTFHFSTFPNNNYPFSRNEKLWMAGDIVTSPSHGTDLNEPNLGTEIMENSDELKLQSFLLSWKTIWTFISEDSMELSKLVLLNPFLLSISLYARADCEFHTRNTKTHITVITFDYHTPNSMYSLEMNDMSPNTKQ